MGDKEFIVSHAHARAPITVTGKTLKEALKKENLNPAIWKPIAPSKAEEPPSLEETEKDNPSD